LQILGSHLHFTISYTYTPAPVDLLCSPSWEEKDLHTSTHNCTTTLHTLHLQDVHTPATPPCTTAMPACHLLPACLEGLPAYQDYTAATCLHLPHPFSPAQKHHRLLPLATPHTTITPHTLPTHHCVFLWSHCSYCTTPHTGPVTLHSCHHIGHHASPLHLPLPACLPTYTLAGLPYIAASFCRITHHAAPHSPPLPATPCTTILYHADSYTYLGPARTLTLLFHGPTCTAPVPPFLLSLLPATPYHCATLPSPFLPALYYCPPHTCTTGGRRRLCIPVHTSFSFLYHHTATLPLACSSLGLDFLCLGFTQQAPPASCTCWLWRFLHRLHCL